MHSVPHPNQFQFIVDRFKSASRVTGQSRDPTLFVRTPENIRRVTEFLDASSHLYKRVCPSVHPSVCPSIRPSVGLSRMLSLKRCETHLTANIRTCLKRTTAAVIVKLLGSSSCHSQQWRRVFVSSQASLKN